jgi:Holliday junction DNA helicase RuvA
MIGYLEGALLKKEAERIMVLAGQVGYEVLLPAFVMETFQDKQIGEHIALNIYFHQTERQPKPVLIGFNLEAEKEFFLHFITVEAIGPVKAIKALNMPVRDIARAIETKDIQKLKSLSGIGERTAQKIVASLQGKMEKFALIRKTGKPEEQKIPEIEFTQQVFELLVSQLGHSTKDANRMIEEAMARRPDISTPEALFDEVYRGERNK